MTDPLTAAWLFLACCVPLALVLAVIGVIGQGLLVADQYQRDESVTTE